MGQVTVGTRHAEEKVDALDADAKRLGLDRSGYMRMALDMTLAAKVTAKEAEPYREQPRSKRSDAGTSRSNGNGKAHAAAAKAPARATSAPARATRDGVVGPKAFRGPIPKPGAKR